MSDVTCSAASCNKKAHTRGLCKTHYNRGIRTGSLAKIPRATPAQRFWSKVQPRSSGCWEWVAYKNAGGYGWARYGDGSALAHRVAYEMMRGPIPEGWFVCHACDNPACVRPDHLFVGSPADNAADMVRKGRQNPAIGDRNPRSKVTVEQVREIIAMRSAGATMVEIGARYGLHPSHVSRICTGARRKYAP